MTLTVVCGCIVGSLSLCGPAIVSQRVSDFAMKPTRRKKVSESVALRLSAVCMQDLSQIPFPTEHQQFEASASVDFATEWQRIGGQHDCSGCVGDGRVRDGISVCAFVQILILPEIGSRS